MAVSYSSSGLDRVARGRVWLSSPCSLRAQSRASLALGRARRFETHGEIQSPGDQSAGLGTWGPRVGEGGMSDTWKRRQLQLRRYEHEDDQPAVRGRVGGRGRSPSRPEEVGHHSHRWILFLPRLFSALAFFHMPCVFSLFSFLFCLTARLCNRACTGDWCGLSRARDDARAVVSGKLGGTRGLCSWRSWKMQSRHR